MARIMSRYLLRIATLWIMVTGAAIVVGVAWMAKLVEIVFG